MDAHVEAGRGDAPAVLWESPALDASERITFRQLQTRVATAAGGTLTIDSTPGAGTTATIELPAVT